MAATSCSVVGCERPAYSRGFCRPHYDKARSRGTLGNAPYSKAPLNDEARMCAVLGCGARVMARGYCAMHYSRWRVEGGPGEAGKRTTSGALEFLLNTALPDRGEACLIWPFHRDEQGRAVIHFGGKTRRVAPIVCGAVRGTSPEGKPEAAHRCGKGHLGCVAPLHLYWASASQNQMDRVEHGTSNRGSRHGMSKLSEEDVRIIRGAAGSQASIADQFGIGRSTVSLIKSRKLWSWLE